jgi:glutamine synthetase adenylyltransferase
MIPEEFVSHARTAAQEARHAFEALVPKLPPSFIEHQRAARHEMLQAMRSLLDAAIERTK